MNIKEKLLDGEFPTCLKCIYSVEYPDSNLVCQRTPDSQNKRPSQHCGEGLWKDGHWSLSQLSITNFITAWMRHENKEEMKLEDVEREKRAEFNQCVADILERYKIPVDNAKDLAWDIRDLLQKGKELNG